MPNTDIKIHTKHKTKRPANWKIVAINDDFTPMDFVMYLLMNYFGHNATSASSITLDIHRKGRAVAGVYTMEVAETKLAMVADDCRSKEIPFRMMMEPE